MVKTYITIIANILPLVLDLKINEKKTSANRR